MIVNSNAIHGFALAVFTAAACVVYERLVQAYSTTAVVLAVLASYLPALVWVMLYGEGGAPVDARFFKLCAVYAALASVATVIWLRITRDQGVLAGGLYEMKYVVVLALFYALAGSKPITARTLLGGALAMLSVYIVSKS